MSSIDVSKVERNSSDREDSQERENRIEIRDLPPEILIAIFLWTQSAHTKQNASFKRRNIPFLLTQICSLWRHLAVQTPELWTTICLTIKKDMDHSIHGALNWNGLVDLWLRRARNFPISVIIYEVQHRNIYHRRHIPKLLLESSDRWKSLDVEMITTGINSETSPSAFLQGTLTNLESLTIRQSKRSRLIQNQPLPAIESVGTAPKLRVIHIMMGSLFLNSPFDFENLTVVDLVPNPHRLEFPLTIDSGLNVIRICPKLNHVRLLCNDRSSETPLSRVEHQSLRILELFEYPPGMPSVEGILEHLVAPFLTSLLISSAIKMDRRRELDGGMPLTLTKFVARIRCSLQRLELLYDYPATVTITPGCQILHELQYLQYFRFRTSCKMVKKRETILDAVKSHGNLPRAPQKLFYWYTPKRAPRFMTLTISSDSPDKGDKFVTGSLY